MTDHEILVRIAADLDVIKTCCLTLLAAIAFAVLMWFLVKMEM